MKAGFYALLALVVFLSSVTQAHAQDTRLALVVGNETGWRGEQRLPWVLSGDLEPMAHILSQRLGFLVVRVSNPSAAKLRQIFQKIRRMVRQKQIKTFLFYYSGHADKKHFHLGPRKAQPLSYQEFLSFFLSLPVKRRFAILDACHGGAVIPLAQRKIRRIRKGFSKQEASFSQRVFRTINRGLPRSQRFRSLHALRRWYRGAIAKGIRPPRRQINFKKLPILRRENGTGTHIMGTVGTAWHDPRLHASLLTHHILRGLRGKADTVKDGRITVEELYNHVQAAARQQGQEVSRFVLFQGDYSFAPNYQSKLQIEAGILGRVKVLVGRFVWRYEKRQNNRVEVAAIAGSGIVEIQHKGRCWRQSIVLPKGRSAQLQRYGQRVGCQRIAKRKGVVALRALTTPLPKRPRPHTLSVAAGYSQLGAGSLRTHNLSLDVGYRWRGWLGGRLRYETGLAPQGWQLHRIASQVDAGYTFQPSTNWGVFVGAYGRLGVLTAQTSPSSRAQTLFWEGGAQADLHWALLSWWGIRLEAQIGINWTPSQAGTPWSVAWGAQLSQWIRFP